MSEHVFKISLGRIHSEKLDRIAEFTSHDDDLKEYAKILLWRAIEQMEEHMHAELYSLYRHEIDVLSEIYRRRSEEAENRFAERRNEQQAKGEMNDGIPF